MRKKIRIYFLVSLITLAVALVGCSSKSTDTAKNALYHKTDVTGPAASFDWNAKLALFPMRKRMLKQIVERKSLQP